MRTTAARPLFAGLVALLTAASCARSPVRPAPFRARADGVESGDLLGAFTGQVLDHGTSRPIAGAMVYATWSVAAGQGLVRPGGFREYVTSTDADGRYAIPRLTDLPRGIDRITDFYLVIYKRGYVAYRSDRRFRDLGSRLDFAQARNQVELERWRDDLSHAKHLRFIGGGAALAALTSWETEPAARELAGENVRLSTDPFGQTPGRGAAAAVVAARLITGADITAITGFDGRFETGPLDDSPDTAEYSSTHLKALDRPESFDAALRLWKLDAQGAQKRYAELLTTLPNTEERNEIADRSMRAARGDVRGLAFLDGRRGAVVMLTCGVAQCRTPEELVALGRLAYERIESLWPLNGGAQ